MSYYGLNQNMGQPRDDEAFHSTFETFEEARSVATKWATENPGISCVVHEVTSKPVFRVESVATLTTEMIS